VFETQTKVTRFVISLVLVAGVYAAYVGDPGPATASESVPIFYVDARGKTGAQIGVELGNSVRMNFPDIGSKIDGYLAYMLVGMASGTGYSAQSIFDGYLVPRIAAIKPGIELRYREEVDAMASSFGSSNVDSLGDGLLSANELWALELFAEIVRGTNCSGFGVFGSYSASNSPIVGRNVDWETNADIRSMQSIIVYRYEDRTLVNVGCAGFSVVVTGFNSDGLFGGVLDSPMGGPYPDPTGKRSYLFDLRNALENHSRISEAANALRDKQYTFSHNILFADTLDIQVLEHPQGEVGRLRTAESQLNDDLAWGKSNQIAVVNFFALAGYSNQRHLSNIMRWNRFRQLATFDTNHPANEDDVKSIMLDTINSPYSIFRDSTAQSMVFVPGRKKLFLYTVPVSGLHDPTPTMNEVSLPIPVDEILGDLDGNRSLGLEDAILGLRVLSNSDSNETVSLVREADKDGKIGLSDVLYVLQSLADLR
jgi:hypothetical protein